MAGEAGRRAWSHRKADLTFSAYVGAQVRARRELVGWSQDQLADRLRLDGLTWHRSAVAAIETGEREPTFSELVLIADVLGFHVTDLFNHGRTRLLALTEVVMATPGSIALRVTAAPEHWSSALLADRAAQEAAMQRLLDDAESGEIASAWHLTVSEAFQVESEIKHEAVVKGAKALGRTPLEIAVASHRIWRRGFADERDARLHDRGLDGATARTRQAVRGRITRELLAELQDKLPKFDEGAQ